MICTFLSDSVWIIPIKQYPIIMQKYWLSVLTVLLNQIIPYFRSTIFQNLINFIIIFMILMVRCDGHQWTVLVVENICWKSNTFSYVSVLIGYYNMIKGFSQEYDIVAAIENVMQIFNWSLFLCILGDKYIIVVIFFIKWGITTS